VEKVIVILLPPYDRSKGCINQSIYKLHKLKKLQSRYLFERNRNKNKNTKCSLLLLFNRMNICYIPIASSFNQKLQTNVPQFILLKEAQQTKQIPKKLNEKKINEFFEW